MEAPAANIATHDKPLIRESLFLSTTWPPPPQSVTATQVEGELVQAFEAHPPHSAHTADVLTWPDTYLIEKRHRDALFDRRMAIKSKLQLTHWLKAFGRVYATHRRNWMQACTVIAAAITALRAIKARQA